MGRAARVGRRRRREVPAGPGHLTPLHAPAGPVLRHLHGRQQQQGAPGEQRRRRHGALVAEPAAVPRPGLQRGQRHPGPGPGRTPAVPAAGPPPRPGRAQAGRCGPQRAGARVLVGGLGPASPQRANRRSGRCPRGRESGAGVLRSGAEAAPTPSCGVRCLLRGIPAQGAGLGLAGVGGPQECGGGRGSGHSWDTCAGRPPRG